MVKLKIQKYYLSLFIVILFHIIANIVWINANTYPSLGEEIGNLSYAKEIYRYINYDEQYKTSGILKILSNLNAEKPPLFQIFSLSLATALGFKYNVVTLANTLLLIFLILATYKTAKHLKDEKTGLLAAAIVSLYWPVYVTSRVYNLEIAITTMVACSILAILDSDFFSKRYRSIICGIVIGLGALTKQSVLLFISGALIYSAYIILKAKDLNRMKNFIISFVTAALVASPYYYPLKHRIKDIFILGNVDQNNFIFYYPELLYKNFLSPYLILLIAIGIYYILKSNNKQKHLLLSWVLLSMTILTIAATKRDRYIIPILPALAIISAYGIFSLRIKILKPILIFAVLYSGVDYCLKISFFEKSPLGYNNKILRYLIPKETNYFNPVKTIQIDDLATKLRNSYSESTNIALIEKNGYSQWLSIFLTEHKFKNVNFFNNYEAALESKSDLIIYTSRESELVIPDKSDYKITYDKQLSFDIKTSPDLKMFISLFEKKD